MKRILGIVLSIFSLLGATELPHAITTQVASVHKGTATTAQAIPQGMSGIVIHNYGGGLSAITHLLVSQGGNRSSIRSYSVVEHDNLPTIKNVVVQGDQVVFGNFYDNVLVIAPNEQTYVQVTKGMRKNWIHPDLYAMFLMMNEAHQMTLDNLKKFAMENQVGLVMLVDKDQIKVLDPMSGAYLLSLPFQTVGSEAVMSPFYARFGQMSSGFLGSSDTVAFPEYYRGIRGIK